MYTNRTFRNFSHRWWPPNHASNVWDIYFSLVITLSCSPRGFFVFSVKIFTPPRTLSRYTPLNPVFPLLLEPQHHDSIYSEIRVNVDKPQVYSIQSLTTFTGAPPKRIWSPSCTFVAGRQKPPIFSPSLARDDVVGEGKTFIEHNG